MTPALNFQYFIHEVQRHTVLKYTQFTLRLVILRNDHSYW